MIPAIEDNFFQREIAEASFRYQSEVESGQRVIVGVNRYVLDDEEPIPILKIDPALEQKQIERLAAVKAGRDSAQRRSAARRAQGGRREGRRQPHAADHRGVARLRHARRDVRRAPRGVGRLARDAGLLAGWAAESGRQVAGANEGRG